MPRGAYLDRACAGDAALLREVKSFLAAHEKADGSHSGQAGRQRNQLGGFRRRRPGLQQCSPEHPNALFKVSPNPERVPLRLAAIEPDPNDNYPSPKSSTVGACAS